MRRKTLLAIFLILMLAVASRWLVVKNQPVVDLEANDIDMRFDYVLSGFELRAYDVDGKLSAVLESPALNQAAISQQGDIEQPRLRLPGDGGSSVALSADNATISSDKNVLTFTGAVSLRDVSVAGGLTTVTTPSLVYDIAAGTAHTDDRVLVVRQGMQLAGTGMDADIRSQRYRLLSKVEGSYEQ